MMDVYILIQQSDLGIAPGTDLNKRKYTIDEIDQIIKTYKQNIIIMLNQANFRE